MQQCGTCRQRGAGGDDIIDKKDVLASQLAGVFFTQCVVALDVMPAFKGAFVGLGGVGANGLQGFNIGYAQGIGSLWL